MAGLAGMVLVVVVGALAAAAALVGIVVAVTRVLGGQAWALLSAALLLAAGAVPPTVLAVLWYARTADYRWAISGPGLFAHLGGGPALLALTLATAVTTTVWWGSALWLAVLGIRGVQDG